MCVFRMILNLEIKKSHFDQKVDCGSYFVQWVCEARSANDANVHRLLFDQMSILVERFIIFHENTFHLEVLLDAAMVAKYGTVRALFEKKEENNNKLDPESTNCRFKKCSTKLTCA